MVLKVKWGLSVKVITFIVLAIIISVVLAMINNFFHNHLWWDLVIVFTVLSVCIYCSLEIPRSIEINENEVILHKLIGKLVININSITYIKPYKPDKSEIRLFGTGGVGGFIGIFINAHIGKYRAYIGDTSQAFLIITELGKKSLLTDKVENSSIFICYYIDI
ncbi:MAG: hypothetical protein LBP83_07505 [Dysgonamonadaceae bacterium]|jgi:uncharacterized membrane protein YfcA|nr:hypothetical protein [Dysgonamonadaceae bacterium]